MSNRAKASKRAAKKKFKKSQQQKEKLFQIQDKPKKKKEPVKPLVQAPKDEKPVLIDGIDVDRFNKPAVKKRKTDEERSKVSLWVRRVFRKVFQVHPGERTALRQMMRYPMYVLLILTNFFVASDIIGISRSGMELSDALQVGKAQQVAAVLGDNKVALATGDAANPTYHFEQYQGALGVSHHLFENTYYLDGYVYTPIHVGLFALSHLYWTLPLIWVILIYVDMRVNMFRVNEKFSIPLWGNRRIRMAASLYKPGVREYAPSVFSRILWYGLFVQLFVLFVYIV